MVESEGLCVSERVRVCLQAWLGITVFGEEVSSSDGMLMKGKCQGEFGSVLGLEHFIAGYV